jgi:hypothetical protein
MIARSAGRADAPGPEDGTGGKLGQMLRRVFGPPRGKQPAQDLPMAAKELILRDRAGLGVRDPGPEAAIRLGLDWLARAQDCSSSRDGGVARHFSLVNGWGESYPETTGYIVPTFMQQAQKRCQPMLRERARRMLDWLAAIQLPEGAFKGGTTGQSPAVPVTFNTGQILLGLASGVAEFGPAYAEPMRRAADWLVTTQDADGKWSRHPTPFATPGLKSYETHVAWALFEAARLEPSRGYAEAAERQVRWALELVRPNGWPQACCLEDPSRPLTHTIGYLLRGVVEAWRFTGDETYLAAARAIADGPCRAMSPDGRIPGRFHADWAPAVDWVCLTGSAQIAHCWLLLFESTDDERWLRAARAANGFVRRTLTTAGDPGICGGVAGSFPIDGAYGRLQYLSWAAKFMIDANQLELELEPQKLCALPA